MLEQGIGSPREVDGSQTAVQQANQFITIRTAGVRNLVRQLEELAESASRQEILKRAVSAAAVPIKKSYREKAKAHEATGNLAAAVTQKYVGYDDGAVMVVGPRQTGPVGSRPGRASANHAWLVEFGTSRRAPGTQGRRTYVNVHQMINKKMTRVGSFNNEQFKNMGRGYYFLMGSIDEPSRQGQGKAGYSRDFAGPGPGGDGRKQHPITLRPGETIAPMPPQNLMEKTINETAQRSFSILRGALEREITARGGSV